MNPNELLTLSAEIAVVLAGFSGVVVSLQRRFEDPTAMAYSRLWRLVETSLSSALFSVVPLLLAVFELGEAQIWALSSLLFAAYLCVLQVYFFARFWDLWHSAAVSWRFNGPTLAIQLGLIAALIANGMGGAPSAGPYVLAIVWYVMLSALVFARLLLLREPR